MRSLRGSVLLGAVLWTLGLFAIIAIVLTFSPGAQETVRVIHGHSHLSAVIAVIAMFSGRSGVPAV